MELEGFTPISWPVDSTARLTRVPWDMQYRDVVRFGDKAGRDEYFNSLKSDSITLEKMTYLKPGEPISVNIPYYQAYKYNYLTVQNPKTPVDDEEPDLLCYFVVGVAYVAPNTTQLSVSLDYWQTYIYDTTFSNCFVDRGHVAVQADNYYRNHNTNGLFSPQSARRYLNVPESLDVGNNYVVANKDTISLQSYSEDEAENFEPWILITSTVSLKKEDVGTVSNPVLKTASGNDADGLISGCEMYALDGMLAKSLFENLQNAGWVSKGIISVQAFPKGFVELGSRVTLGTPSGAVVGYEVKQAKQILDFKKISDFAGNFDLKSSLGIAGRYGKLFTYPYSFVEISNFQGQTLLLKPELVNGTDLTLDAMACCVVPFCKVMIYPLNYNAQKDGLGRVSRSFSVPGTKYINGARQSWGLAEYPHNGDSTDTAISISNFPSFMIVNDGVSNYLASTKNTREYNYAAAGWSNSKANMSADVAYSQANRQIQTNRANQDISNVQSLVNAGTSAVGSLISGNIAGAITGGINSAANYWANNAQFSNNQNLATKNALQNYNLAQTSAQGDYQMAIKSINATVQDAQLTSPSTSGQVGGEGFNMANGFTMFEIRYKTVSPDMLNVIADYFVKYGYAVHETMTPPADLACMTNFTYWKMLATYISCAKADETAKDVLRGILEKGVTVWRKPDLIGLDSSYTNNAPLDFSVY